jgi:hypothetical protein
VTALSPSERRSQVEHCVPSDQNDPADSRRVVWLDCQFHLRRSHLSRMRESHNNTRPIEGRKLTHKASPHKVIPYCSRRCGARSSIARGSFGTTITSQSSAPQTPTTDITRGFPFHPPLMAVRGVSCAGAIRG